MKVQEVNEEGENVWFNVEIIHKLYNLSKNEVLTKEEFQEVKRDVLNIYEENERNALQFLFYRMLKMIIFPELQSYFDYIELSLLKFRIEDLKENLLNMEILKKLMTPQFIRECFQMAVDVFELDLPVKDRMMLLKNDERVLELYKNFDTFDKLFNADSMNDFLEKNMNCALKEII